MDKGFCILAQNNSSTDYVRQAYALALSIHKFNKDQKVTINELKELFPSASEEIDLIANSTKLEFLKIKKDELEKISQERPGLKRFLPERWIFRLPDLGTIEDIDELIEKELSLTQN